MVSIPFVDAVGRYACFDWDFGRSTAFRSAQSAQRPLSIVRAVQSPHGTQLFYSSNDKAFDRRKNLKSLPLRVHCTMQKHAEALQIASAERIHSNMGLSRQIHSVAEKRVCKYAVCVLVADRTHYRYGWEFEPIASCIVDAFELGEPVES